MKDMLIMIIIMIFSANLLSIGTSVIMILQIDKILLRRKSKYKYNIK